MSKLRILVPTALLAAIASGCFLISGQFLLSIDLDPISVSHDSPVEGLLIDFTQESAYQDHKDKIKALADLALLGKITNTGLSDLSAEVYLLDGSPGDLSAAAIRSSGTRVWGPLSVAPGSVEDLTWDRSAALFGAGKPTLLDRIQAGQIFTLYAIGPASGFEFDFDNGVFVAVLSAAN